MAHDLKLPELRFSHAEDIPSAVAEALAGLDPSEPVAAGTRAAGILSGRVDADIIEVEPTLASAASLEERWRCLSNPRVLAVGGGGALDVAKHVANRLGLQLTALPTAISHDGLSSPVAVLRDDSGRSTSLPSAPPDGILVPVRIVGSAPRRHLLAGVGDCLSNIGAVEDWRLAHEVDGEAFDEVAAGLSDGSANAAATLSAEMSTDDVGQLVHAVLLGGLAMQVAGTSRPCSGACHKISHALDQLGSKNPHGLQVALGGLFGLHLRDSPRFGFIVRTHRKFDLPMVPEDLGLSDDTFAHAVELAPSTRPGRLTILETRSLTRPQIRSELASLREHIRDASDATAETDRLR